MGFEPTHAEHIGLAVQRLNHSATSSLDYLWCLLSLKYGRCFNRVNSRKQHKGHAEKKLDFLNEGSFSSTYVPPWFCIGTSIMANVASHKREF